MTAAAAKIFNRSNIIAALTGLIGFGAGTVWPMIREELHWSDELTNKERDFVLKMIEVQRNDSPATAQSTAVLTGVVAKRYLDAKFAEEFTNAISSRALVLSTTDAAPKSFKPAAPEEGKSDEPVTPATAQTPSPIVAAALAQTDQAAQLAASFSSAGVKQQPAAVREALKAPIARAFVHVGVESDRGTGARLKDDLGKALGTGWQMYGVELVPGFKGATQVRYFYPADQAQAQTLADTLAASFPDVRCQRIPGYENRPGVKPRLFETWLAPGAKPSGAKGPKPNCAS